MMISSRENSNVLMSSIPLLNHKVNVIKYDLPPTSYPDYCQAFRIKKFGSKKQHIWSNSEKTQQQSLERATKTSKMSTNHHPQIGKALNGSKACQE